MQGAFPVHPTGGAMTDCIFAYGCDQDWTLITHAKFEADWKKDRVIIQQLMFHGERSKCGDCHGHGVWYNRNLLITFDPYAMLYIWAKFEVCRTNPQEGVRSQKL